MATTTFSITHVTGTPLTAKSCRGEGTMKELSWMVVGLALMVSLVVGSAAAGEQFATLNGIQAEAMSTSEMAAVEGKFYDYIPLGGFNWALVWVDDASGHTWLLPTWTYLGQRQLPRQITLQDIKNAFPDNYRNPGQSSSANFFSQQRLDIYFKDLRDGHSLLFGYSTKPGVRP